MFKYYMVFGDFRLEKEYNQMTGLIPARRAIKIKPIDALQDE